MAIYKKYFDDQWHEADPEKATHAAEIEYDEDGRVIHSVIYKVDSSEIPSIQKRRPPQAGGAGVKAAPF